MNNNTIVTASDMNYAWGVWLLVASIRKSGMDEPILIGTFNWTDEWIEDICKFPGVKTVALPGNDKRNVTCQKPEIMMRAEGEFITWIDCDGVLSGNCSDILTGQKNELFVRSRLPEELVTLYPRLPGENPLEIPQRILDVWQRDVGEKTTPARRYGCTAALVGIHSSYKPFLQKWKDLMLSALPFDVEIVDRGNTAYFQTDESVLNAVTLFAEDAPVFAANYKMDDQSRAHYIHFGYQYNPKPWLMWNSKAMRFYDLIQDIVDWAVANGYEPKMPRPYTLRRENKWLSALMSPIAQPLMRAKNFKKRTMKKLKRKFSK